MRPESRLAHAGSQREKGQPTSPPLVLSSVFVSEGPPEHARAYGRDANPSWEALEEGLGALEDGEAVLFASGQAAAMTLMLALAEGRQHLLMPRDGYYRGRVLAEKLRPHGAVPVYLDMQDLDCVEQELALAPSLLWVETPTNPLLRVADMEKLSKLALSAGAPVVVDNTVATSFLQKPLEWGATASLYSITKAASGHADVVLGAVVTRDHALAKELRDWRGTAGAIAGPFEAWLALRGLKTLPVRIVRQSESALAIAHHLMGHPRVGAVYYPGTEPSTLELARRQMPLGFGPLLSFELRYGDGGAVDPARATREADAVVAASRLIVPATSFGGVESSWERRARWASETAPPGLIRLSVGLEAVGDLIGDIDAALEACC